MRWARDVVITETRLQQFTVTDNVQKGSRRGVYISGKILIFYSY